MVSQYNPQYANAGRVAAILEELGNKSPFRLMGTQVKQDKTNFIDATAIKLNYGQATASEAWRAVRALSAFGGKARWAKGAGW